MTTAQAITKAVAKRDTTLANRVFNAITDRGDDPQLAMEYFAQGHLYDQEDYDWLMDALEDWQCADAA